MKKFSVVLVMIMLLFTLAACGGSSFSEGVYISEVMADNTMTLIDENGEYCDWIELYNPTSVPVSLTGYTITDNSSNKFTFPEVAIGAGQCLVLFANGVEKVDHATNTIHIPLSVGTKGEKLFLYNAEGELIFRLGLPKMEADKSYGVSEDESLVVFDVPSPGKPNFIPAVTVTDTNTDTPVSNSGADIEVTESGIYINEYSPNSTQTLMDDEGEFVAWVEIYNSTDKQVNLKGFSLSDDNFDKKKWVFPDYSILPGAYGIVYLSGKDKPYSGGLAVHSSFKLNGKEETLYLYSKTGHVIDECQVFEIFANLSCGRIPESPNKFAFFARPTPGRHNIGAHFDSIDSARYTGNREIAITEVAAVNNTKQHIDGEYYDFIEIYNSSKVNLNLGNYKLSDSKKAGSFKALPQRIVEPGEYVVVYCGDEDYVSPDSGNIYVSFGLNRYGETVYLLDKYNVVIDAFKYGRTQNGYSSGRDINGNGDVLYYAALTPGENNPVVSLKKSLPNPEFSQKSTYMAKGTTIEITAPYGEIHFTIDGSTPTINSPIYTGPLTVGRTVVVRARNFAVGYVPSDTVTATYLTDRKHDLPVVFLTTESKNLYDYNTGIWATGPGASDEFPYVGANFWQNWERPVHFEYMTADGVSQVDFDAGISVFGQYSRANDQKSVEIKLKDKYGPTKVCYPFFGDDAVNVFSSFVLRNGGQDYNIAHIRDAFAAMVIKDQMDIDLMDYQPVVCYVNGVYHGIYDMREKIDEDYLANNHGADPDNVDLIKANSDVKAGSINNYDALLDYVLAHDLSNDVYYQKVCEWVDIDELINYWLCESFFTNTDTGNIKFWRENKEGAKWRWIFFDVDWCLFGSTYDYNLIGDYLDPLGHGVGYGFSTTLYINLYKNPAFRTRMLEIFSQHLKTTFRTDRMLKILDEMIAEIDAEMPYYLERFDVAYYEDWQSNVEYLKEIIVAKRKLFPSQMVEALGMSAAEVQQYLSDVGE